MDSVDISKVVAAVVSGGWPTWIAGGVTLLLGLLFWFWSRARAADAADHETQTEVGGDQAGGKKTGQDAENDLDQAEQGIGDVRKENPDAGKLPRAGA